LCVAAVVVVVVVVSPGPRVVARATAYPDTPTVAFVRSFVRAFVRSLLFALAVQ
jgi:hypothetical protein